MLPSAERLVACEVGQTLALQLQREEVRLVRHA